MIELDLPMPPSVNKLYATVRGRRIMTTKGKAVKHEITQLVVKHIASMPDLFHTENKLRLTVDLYFSAVENAGWSKGKAKNRYKRIDVSNRAKLLEDALFLGIGIDDSLIFELIMRKHAATDGEEYCHVKLEEL
jgi:Holliday junction resolvase RusA-like endonuclease